MKKFLIVVLLLCVLAVGGIVTMVVMSFNPSAYERDVKAYLQKLTGRDVSIGGTTAISWNPEPTVVMNDIKISNIDKSQNPVMLSIEKVTVSIAWKSLLKSPLEIKKVELKKPVLHLERLESNRANFTFPFLLDPNFQLQEVDMISDTPSTSAKIESVLVQEGTIDYSNQITGTDFQVSNINGSLVVDSVRGPFRFNGTGMKDKGEYSLLANVGHFQGAASVPVTVQMSENNTRLELKITGNLTPASIDKWFDGSIQFNIGRLDTLLTDQNLPVPDLSTGAMASGNATLLVAPASDTLKDFVIQIGEGEKRSAFTGTVKRTVSAKKYAYDADITTDLFRLEQWQPYLKQLNWDWITGEKIYPNIQFKVLAEAVPYGSETVRNLTMKGNYTNSILSVEEGSASLADGAKATFNIIGKPKNQKAFLECGIRAEMPAVQNVLKWLFGDQQNFGIPALAQKGSFNGQVIWEPEEVVISAKEFKIGDASIMGSIRKTLNDEAVYTIKLAARDINLDSYTGWTPPEKPILLKELPAVIQHSFERPTGLEKMKALVQIDISKGMVFGIPVERLYVEGSVDNQKLKIDQLIAQNMAAADMAVAGIFDGIGRPQMNVDVFQIGLKTKQLPAFLKRLNLVSDLPLVNQASDTTFKLALKGGKNGSWGIDALSELSNASIKLKGELNVGDAQSVQNMAFEITHPNFQTFMKLLDPTFSFVPKLDGTFKTTGIVSGTKDRFELKNTTMAVGLQKMRGTLAFDNRQIKTLTADVVAPSLDLERFTGEVNPFYSEVNGLSKNKLDLSLLNNWNWNLKLNATQLVYKDINIHQADVQISLQNKELNLVKLTGVSGGSNKSPVKITAKLDWNTTPSFITNFDIKNIPLRSDFMVLPELAMGGGSLSLNGELKARGETPADFMTNLNGQGTMLLQGGQLIGTDIEKMIPIITRAVQRSEGAKVIEPEFKRVLNTGKTVLSSVSGDYVVSNGIVRMMDLTLETANAMANPTQIVWDIPKRTLDISIPVLLKPLNSLPAFILGISVTANSGSYKPNYSDLLAVLSNRSQTVLADNMRQKEVEARAASIQKRSDRLTESQKLTKAARQAVSQMEQKMTEFPFEKGRRLLATAKDTLTLLNQLAVKEEPTDAQLIQQIEYARTVLLKADEFNRVLSQETLFNAQKQMGEYRTKGGQMTDQLSAWAKGYPDIKVLSKLAETAEQNREIIELSAKKLTPNLPVAESEELLATCTDAFGNIEKAYQHATRFDLSGIPNQVTGEIPQEKHQVKGSFKRSE